MGRIFRRSIAVRASQSREAVGFALSTNLTALRIGGAGPEMSLLGVELKSVS